MAKPVKKISFVGGRGPYVYARFTEAVPTVVEGS